MTEEEMRQILLQAYPNSQAWAVRIARMPSSRIFAIYMRLVNRKDRP